LTAEETSSTINSLDALLASKGLDVNDFITAIDAIAKIKERDLKKLENEAAKELKKQKKIFVDKEFVYETRNDVFIYRDGRTKSGRYYVRIYDPRTKRTHSESLRTSNRIQALSKAEQLYREHKEALHRGVKVSSINTKELIRLYQVERRKEITVIPHMGITPSSFKTLCTQLKYWENYINAKGHKNTKLEDLPTELGRGFGIWVKELKKKEYVDRERSNETINSMIAAVKKMYRDIAIDEKYITQAEFPIFRYLKINRETKHKRDIIEPEEFTMMRKWMENIWCREKDIDDLERVKRRVYGLYLTINYYTGARCKEMLGLRWKDIQPIATESKEDQRINRSIFIPAENAKTGRSRHIVAPVAFQFERIRKHYKKLNITTQPEDFVFINLSKTKRGTNTPYNNPAMEKRLKACLIGSGLQKKLDETGRHITQYSARHYAATQALMRGVDIYDLSINLGTSVNYIEKTYSHITSMMKSKELTKGLGYWRDREIGKETGKTEYEIAKENGFINDGDRLEL
jgi:integrase